MGKTITLSCTRCSWYETDWSGVEPRDECPECGHDGWPFAEEEPDDVRAVTL